MALGIRGWAIFFFLLFSGTFLLLSSLFNASFLSFHRFLMFFDLW